MILGLSIVFATFLVLGGATLRSSQNFRQRRLNDWLIDSICLLSQGLVIPVVQTLLLERVWTALFPNLQGRLQIGGIGAFILSFAIVDYLYYWNHRALHSPKFWAWHRLHHSVQSLDFYATSRNSFFTPALIVYVWANSLFVFLLGNASAFILASSIGAALDLWRHSGFSLNKTSILGRALSPWLIFPQDHEWHHACSTEGVNFGANLNCWDRLHGTYQVSRVQPRGLGVINTAAPTWREFIWPFQPRDAQ